MKILIIGLNYAPELTGIAVYTAGMAEELVRRGHSAVVITSPPFFPAWKVNSDFSARHYKSHELNGVRIVRCPLYVPARPTGARRILHYASFTMTCLIPSLRVGKSLKPDIVFVVAPALLSALAGLSAARVCKAVSWLHIQDFEVEAAFATQVLSATSFWSRLARRFEKWVITRFDRVSSISPAMCEKLIEKGVRHRNVYELRNWSDVDNIKPSFSSAYRDEWAIKTPHVALYSGSIGNKQGLEIVLGAAEALAHRKDLHFIICGDGPNRRNLEKKAAHLSNVEFRDLQPAERLSDLLNLATVHLLPQLGSAADLVLPSKLLNMLASGKPVIATAAVGTGLYDELQNCGIVVPPDNTTGFANAIAGLIDNASYRIALGANARRRAVEVLSCTRIMDSLESELATVARA